MSRIRSTVVALAAAVAVATPMAAAPAMAQTGSTRTIEREGRLCTDGRKYIDVGHLDIAATWNNGQLGIGLIDDSGLHDDTGTIQDLDDIVLGVKDEAIHEEPLPDHWQEQMDFIPNGPSFLLPAVQDHSIIWPGYNTQYLDYNNFDGSVYLHLEPESIPQGADFGLFLFPSIFDQTATVHIDSTKDDYTIEVPQRAHVHVNWVFDTPGTYVLDTYYTAKSTNGTELRSPDKTLTLLVGDEAIAADCFGETPAADNTKDPAPAAPAPSAPATTTPSASASPTPSASPSPTPSASASPTPSASASPSPSASATPSPSPSAPAAPTPTAPSKAPLPNVTLDFSNFKIPGLSENVVSFSVLTAALTSFFNAVIYAIAAILQSLF